MTDLNPVDNYLHGSWEALGNGAPLLVALAQLCCERWVRQGTDAKAISLEELSPEARAILFAARQRGIIELRAVNSAFDAAARLLAVYVELSDERTVAFRDARDPAFTVSFVDGFRQLCERALVMHHIYRDFSLSPQGWTLAQQVDQADVQALLDRSTEFGLHD